MSDNLYGWSDASINRSQDSTTIAFTFYKSSECLIDHREEYRGNHKTNTIQYAELYAMCKMIQKADELNLKKVVLYTDSKTVSKLFNSQSKRKAKRTSLKSLRSSSTPKYFDLLLSDLLKEGMEIAHKRRLSIKWKSRKYNMAHNLCSNRQMTIVTPQVKTFNPILEIRNRNNLIQHLYT